MPNQAESRARQNPPYKEDETEISLISVGEWIGIPKPRAACRWLLHFLTPIELGKTIVSEWIEYSQHPMASLSAGKDCE